MRKGNIIGVRPIDRLRLEAVVTCRNSPQEPVGRTKAVLATADAVGAAATGLLDRASRPSVRRWRQRFAQDRIGGLLRDKARTSDPPPLPPAMGERVVELPLAEPRDG